MPTGFSDPLDPVGVGDGGQMRVEWVRLVPK